MKTEALGYNCVLLKCLKLPRFINKHNYVFSLI